MKVRSLAGVFDQTEYSKIKMGYYAAVQQAHGCYHDFFNVGPYKKFRARVSNAMKIVEKVDSLEKRGMVNSVFVDAVNNAVLNIQDKHRRATMCCEGMRPENRAEMMVTLAEYITSIEKHLSFILKQNQVVFELLGRAREYHRSVSGRDRVVYIKMEYVE